MIIENERVHKVCKVHKVTCFIDFMNFMNLIFFVMKKIGILGFQGAIIEHERQIKAIGHEPVIVKYPEQLEEIDGIILPGGESTTMGKILNRTGLMEPLRGKIQSGLPVWGTCAGMILLAKELVNDSVTHLGVMDIAVRRNAYGSQIDSFATKKAVSYTHLTLPTICSV